jgi:hypothetical protein
MARTLVPVVVDQEAAMLVVHIMLMAVYMAVAVALLVTMQVEQEAAVLYVSYGALAVVSQAH